MSVTHHTEANSLFGRASFDDALESFFEHPWLFLLRLALTVCLVTRGATGLYTRLQPQSFNTTGSKTIPRVPYWIPYFGQQISFSLRSQSWLLRLSQSYKSDIFTLTLSGRKYHVLTSQDVINCLNDPAAPVNTAPHSLLRSRRFFANRHANLLTSARVATALRAYRNNESRVDGLCKLLETNSYNLISPSKSWIDQAQWERNAEVTVLSTSTKPSELSVSASLPMLVKEFSSHIILSTLLGLSFMESNPSFVSDLFAFSVKYSYFMAGLPYWITPGLGPPALAREKCLLALESLVDAMVNEIDRRSGDARSGMGALYDLDSVHSAVWELAKRARQEHSGNGQGNGLGKKGRIRAIACDLLEITWFVNYYAANSVVWILVEMYKKTNEVLLRSARKEITELLEVVPGKATGLPFEDPPRLHFRQREGHSVVTDNTCPALRASLVETLRLRMWFEEYMEVNEDFVLEAGGGITVDGHTKLQQSKETYEFRKGECLYIAHGVSGHDPRRWDQPERFDAGRLMIATESESKFTDATTRASTSQKLDSKRYILQVGEEITYIVAAILSMYDIEALDGGGLSEPKSTTIAGVAIPQGSLRVKISRRLLR
ncbi:hypothetical protein H2198_001940 [Neophaeococcomyces mojaviensis]|uniref:Uncharacterized protein n=1 Tax=Neophaeococcomyces mojaviensis TaxID=3383035 RepID=A0ACC3AGA1_9EURO|nr:hypothetical protein H2198_001940 [Knufia sp. JES_112]